MSKTLNHYIATLDYTDKTLLVFSGACTGISLSSFTNVISTPIAEAGASIDLVFLSVMGLDTNVKEKKSKT